MIEEILKSCDYYSFSVEDYDNCKKEILELLKFKLAWEELKTYIKEDVESPCQFVGLHLTQYHTGKEIENKTQELELKYNIRKEDLDE